jgi:flagellar hook-associated protein 3 FlgL
VSIGRITTLMTAQNTLSDLSLAYDRLTNTQNELASGKKIQNPSDDPYGMSVIMQTQGDLGALTAYNNNVTDGQAYATASQTAMTNIANIVQRARELTVSAANGTNTTSDLQDDAAEVGQLIDAVKQEANTTYDGQYVFAGTSTSPPYQQGSSDAFSGNSGPAAAVNRLIGPNTQVQVNVDLSSVLGSGFSQSAQGDGKLLATLRTIYNDMTSGNTQGLSNADLTNLDSNFDNLTQMQASLGATTDRLQLASNRISDLQVADTQVLSNTQDADMAQTEIDYSTQQAAYEAALKAGANIVQDSLMSFLPN